MLLLKKFSEHSIAVHSLFLYFNSVCCLHTNSNITIIKLGANGHKGTLGDWSYENQYENLSEFFNLFLSAGNTDFLFTLFKKKKKN